MASNGGKLQYFEARNLASSYGIPLYRDFHTLDSDTVDKVLRAADFRKYRKPRNANGSRARCFYEYLNRAATVKPRLPR